MAEMAPVVHIGENSPEQIAYKLLQTIASNEKKTLRGSPNATADRKWLLDTYVECLAAVSGKRLGPGGPIEMIPETMTPQEAADAYADLVRER
jgi:hypothetical protein